jgi:putative SOS response-associated peptidase YedK
MCGYLRREPFKTSYREFLQPYGMGNLFDRIDEPPTMGHFLPAFAQHTERKIPNIIIQENGERKVVDATWWYECYERNGRLTTGGKQSFNARNLKLDLWSEAIEKRRAIAIMTGIGESRMLEGRKTANHYLMIAGQPFFIGLLYRSYPHNLYSTAVITRDKQLGFEKFHDKAFPLFLPYDKHFIDLWLDPEVPSTEPEISELLANPKWFTALQVTRVKTFTKGELYKDSVTEILEAS